MNHQTHDDSSFALNVEDVLPLQFWTQAIFVHNIVCSFHQVLPPPINLAYWSGRHCIRVSQLHVSLHETRHIDVCLREVDKQNFLLSLLNCETARWLSFFSPLDNELKLQAVKGDAEKMVTFHILFCCSLHQRRRNPIFFFGNADSFLVTGAVRLSSRCKIRKFAHPRWIVETLYISAAPPLPNYYPNMNAYCFLLIR